MQLSKEEIQHIANLARLELSEEEIKIYGEQLSHILSYIDQLKEVDTAGVEPTAQVTGMKNVLRSDEIVKWDKKQVEQALKQASELKDKMVKVKRILNQ
ncbi:MAG: Aspartyl/glutamyl-tRNA(Asn/Gln) amidotransferase subunit C [Parcubacteria group bacterium ADurb.Bin316]|nr:MAG: Aspartyl/glutamyl-tRNA(Asn/Gln) amidotransferase subunit C [Parcubacteria group bacterium ADurb.Bin316]HOZ56509.1 Asp-tRNA(Asn)/Glu-tRNA(Gln) amidotransferase subunit GatC [bacterium]